MTHVQRNIISMQEGMTITATVAEDKVLKGITFFNEVVEMFLQDDILKGPKRVLTNVVGDRHSFVVMVEKVKN